MIYERFLWFIIGGITISLLVLGMISAVHGEERLHIVRVRVLIAEELAEHSDMIQRAQETLEYRLAQVGIELKTLHYTIIPDPAAGLNTITDYWLGKTRWAWERSGYITRRRRSINLVYTNPLDGAYFGGWSSMRCALAGGVALVHLNPLSAAAENKTALVATHEAGHLAGAMDNEILPATLMHRTAPRWLALEPDPIWAAQSRDEITYCIKSYRRRIRRERFIRRRAR